MHPIYSIPSCLYLLARRLGTLSRFDLSFHQTHAALGYTPSDVRSLDSQTTYSSGLPMFAAGGPLEVVRQSGPRKKRTSAKKNRANTRNNKSLVSRTTSSGQTCQTPGCVSPVSQNEVAGKYCTRAHQEYTFHLSIMPRKPVLNSAQVGGTWLHILSQGPNDR